MFELADCREAGFDNYFSKPVKLKTIVDAADGVWVKMKHRVDRAESPLQREAVRP
ncbi:hypothetical protein QUF70_00960 [Desulfobacterales bacterium HSG17]|nr:hypothetical protein [Desulfobacterales bacterium HSG17]